MMLAQKFLAIIPGRIGMRAKKKVTRARVIGADERFARAIRNCKSRLAIDLGANQGKYTKILAESFDHVIAFEPNPDAYRILEKNTSAYENIKLYQQAAGTEEGTATMHLRNGYKLDPASYSEGTTLFRSKENINLNDSISVEAVDIVQFIEGLKQNIGIIKIDIEGA